MWFALLGLATAAPAHVDLELGLTAGAADYSATPFSFDSGVEQAGAVSPFLGVPYSGVAQAGFAFDVRLVKGPLRVGIGARAPVSAWQMEAQPVLVNEETFTTSVRKLSQDGLRLGIGVEVPHDVVRPSIDLVGELQFLDTEIAYGTALARYSGRAFSYTVEPGVSVSLDDTLYLTGVGSIGVWGPTEFGGKLGVGLRF